MFTVLKGLTRLLVGAASARLPVVCIFGRQGITLTTPIADDAGEKRLDCRCYSTDADLERVLGSHTAESTCRIPCDLDRDGVTYRNGTSAGLPRRAARGAVWPRRPDDAWEATSITLGRISL